MLENMYPTNEMRALYAKKRLAIETVSIPKTKLDDYKASGWRLDRELTRSLRMTREKSKPRLLEDHMWVLMYRMGFQHLSGHGGALLKQGSDGSGPTSQIDVVAIDDEVAVAIECKSSEKYAKRPQFSEEMSKHALIRGRLAQAVSSLWPLDQKRQIILIMMMSNIQLTDNDKARAAAENIVIMDDHDLQYYTALVGHLGPAARYQFLADMLPGKRIPGLAIRVPAVRTKMGGVDCFNFSISPEYLLKIAYVSHRAKGKGSDVNTYQRMISKGRLAKISQYITNRGIFPTNIVINLEADRVQFERVKQETGTSENGTLGWLDIRPTYKAAWVIDGQHRLFAYSGHPHAHRDRLAVLAFRGLSPSKQAELFIDINAKQKSVKQSLLQELYAELHWDAEKPSVRVLAIISKTVQLLEQDRNSPFFQRIKTADAERDPKRCITYQSLDSAIGKAKLHIVREKNGQPLEFGPLWP